MLSPKDSPISVLQGWQNEEGLGNVRGLLQMAQSQRERNDKVTKHVLGGLTIFLLESEQNDALINLSIC